MRALILAPFAARYIDRLRQRLDVIHESWLETHVLQDPDELGARLQAQDISLLVVEADFVFEEVFDAAPVLRFVGVCRNALNHIDIERATAGGVVVSHAPGRNTNAVAEMTLALMLSLCRRIPAAHTLVSGGGWRDPSAAYERLRGREIAGSTVGVFGYGQIGREVARICRALGARVLVHDPMVDVASQTADLRAAGVDELLAASDFVTMHVPDNEATFHMVNGSFLSNMKSEGYLINTSGGAVVDPVALAGALERGEIAGAALDVFEGHPLPQSSLLMSAPNLLMTPHIGGATSETIDRHSRMMTEEIERFLDGQPLLHAVNAARSDAT